ncbi:hypothetical protein LQ318_13380 [Aliifodinibius salicampi]|uniref:Lipoprotein n=1 Tax=Fodinibius salicampi TaxID=1920655 RepID=A0ABT3Q1A9_9BACT|nr:hypothetical protein [Fodinibius salicampi]MCW9713897.1 hypothetical protein [Fodinibius salicampi]
MKNILLVAVCLIVACSSTPELKEGHWTGHLTPMNHPEMSIPVSYEVAYTENGLDINIIGSDGISASAQNPHIERDTLFFMFNEPEEQVTLECELARNNASGFSGECTDSSGKWAQFTMVSPD